MEAMRKEFERHQQENEEANTFRSLGQRGRDQSPESCFSKCTLRERQFLAKHGTTCGMRTSFIWFITLRRRDLSSTSAIHRGENVSFA